MIYYTYPEVGVIAFIYSLLALWVNTSSWNLGYNGILCFDSAYDFSSDPNHVSGDQYYPNLLKSLILVSATIKRGSLSRKIDESI